MPPILRNILAIITGVLLGGAVNMGFILASPYVIPPPAGADLTTEEGLKASMHLMGPEHFIMPFLAHAAGTLAGAFIAAKLAAGNKFTIALCIGVFFLVGGIASVKMLPSPLWFSATDIIAAYIPMAYLGGKLALGNAR